MALDKCIEVTKVVQSAKPMRDGSYAKTLVYEFYADKLGPFREEFFSNEQNPEAIHRRLNEHVRLLRETGALKAEGA